MRQYTKLIILGSVLLVLIAAITLVMIFDIDLKLFKNLSIAGIQEKKLSVETLMQTQTMQEILNTQAKQELQQEKNDFDVAKDKYESIGEDTISIVQEATKEESYFIEYLWIVLGNYATLNDVSINIMTPGSTLETGSKEEAAVGDDKNNKTEDKAQNTNANNSITNYVSGIKIIVEGRYANLADFVFDVENNKSLRFKLDNIRMNYTGDNKVRAIFDVLSLSVLK